MTARPRPTPAPSSRARRPRSAGVALAALLLLPALSATAPALAGVDVTIGPVTFPPATPGTPGLPGLPAVPATPGLPGAPPGPSLPVPALGLEACKTVLAPPFLHVSTTAGTWEYGDAPDDVATHYVGGGAAWGKFPTLAGTANAAHPGQPAARHRVGTLGWLGNASLYPPGYAGPASASDTGPTHEADADSAPDEDITNTNIHNGIANLDGREDGLLAANLPAGGSGTFTYRVSSSTGFWQWFVNILVDWDYDGRWRNAPGAPPEWVTVNQVISVPPGQTLEFTTPSFVVGKVPGMPWTRITLSNSPVFPHLYGPAGWDGETPPGVVDVLGQKAWTCGETEDYCGDVSVFDPTGERGDFVACVCPGPDEPPPPPPPPPACPPQQDVHYGAVVGVSSGGLPATWAASPWTGTAGWTLDQARVAAHGIQVEIRYCNIEYGISRLVKVAPAPGTSPPGWRHTGSGFALCSSGTHLESYPYGTSSGYALDRGDYDVEVEIWWGCPNSPGVGTSITPYRVIVT